MLSSHDHMQPVPHIPFGTAGLDGDATNGLVGDVCRCQLPAVCCLWLRPAGDGWQLLLQRCLLVVSAG
jgi:hypothetical protein